jgi:hypothetical protein
VVTVRPAQTSPLPLIAFSLRELWPVFALVFLLSGCAAPESAPVRASPLPAHLVVINETDYEWRLAIRRAPDGPGRDVQVLARASQTLDLPGGDYMIEQTMLATSAAPALSRKISSRLEPGQTYRWRLATLLSESDGDAGAP